jgi:hypothetical protein
VHLLLHPNSILGRILSIGNTEYAEYCILEECGLSSNQISLLRAGCPLYFTRKAHMSDSPLSVPDAASRFFDNYLNCLIKASIPEKQRRWYLKRVEAFIKDQNGWKIKTLTRIDIYRYFEIIGRKNRLNGWQYQQCISAIRILYCQLLKTQVCRDVDWGCWIDFAKQQKLDHPTTENELTLSIGLGRKC